MQEPWGSPPKPGSQAHAKVGCEAFGRDKAFGTLKLKLRVYMGLYGFMWVCIGLYGFEGFRASFTTRVPMRVTVVFGTWGSGFRT